VTEVNTLSQQLLEDGHPDEVTINEKRDEVNEAWARLKQLSLLRQERLFGAHEIQRFNRWVIVRSVVRSGITICWNYTDFKGLCKNGSGSSLAFRVAYHNGCQVSHHISFCYLILKDTKSERTKEMY